MSTIKEVHMTDENKAQEKASFNAIRKNIRCPSCGRGPFVALPPNFPVVDLICRFCGETAQVNSLHVNKRDSRLPGTVISSAWKPQKIRIAAGIYKPLYIVTFFRKRAINIYCVSAVTQKRYKKILFKKRKPLSRRNVRAGFQGFVYRVGLLPKRAVKLEWSKKK